MNYRIFGEGCIHITTMREQENNSFQFGPVNISPGGNAANVARQLNNYGNKLHFYSVVGNDTEGDMFCSILQSEGINIEKVKRIDNTATTKVSIELNPEEICNIVAQVDPNMNFNIEQLSSHFKEIKEDDIVYIPAFPNYYNLINSQEVKKGTIYLDFGFSPLADKWEEYTHELVSLLDNADYIIANGFSFSESEFNFLKEQLNNTRCKAIIVTFAGSKILIITPYNIKNIPLSKIKEVNPVGAGDCFIGTFIHFHTKGIDIEKSVELAHHAAMWKVGKFDSIPSLTDIPHEVI